MEVWPAVKTSIKLVSAIIRVHFKQINGFSGKVGTATRTCVHNHHINNVYVQANQHLVCLAGSKRLGKRRLSTLLLIAASSVLLFIVVFGHLPSTKYITEQQSPRRGVVEGGIDGGYFPFLAIFYYDSKSTLWIFHTV